MSDPRVIRQGHVIEDLAVGDVVVLQSEGFSDKSPYRATVVERSAEIPGGVWVQIATHRLLLGPDGRVLVSSRLRSHTRILGLPPTA